MIAITTRPNTYTPPINKYKRFNRLYSSSPKQNISFSSRLKGDELKRFLKEIRELYDTKIVKDLDLVNEPELTIKTTIPGDIGGSSFQKNEITVSNNILTWPGLKKAYGIKKNGDRVLIINKKNYSPHLFFLGSLGSAELKLKKLLSPDEFKGFNKIELAPFSKGERKKLFTQVLFHEGWHSYQTRLNMKTEGIGIEKTVKQNTYYDPIQRGLEKILQTTAGLLAKDMEKAKAECSFLALDCKNWEMFKNLENTIKKDSPLGKLAHQLYEGQKNYNSSSLEVLFKKEKYSENLIETHAHQKAYKSIVKLGLGEWPGLPLT